MAFSNARNKKSRINKKNVNIYKINSLGNEMRKEKDDIESVQKSLKEINKMSEGYFQTETNKNNKNNFDIDDKYAIKEIYLKDLFYSIVCCSEKKKYAHKILVEESMNIIMVNLIF